MLCSSSTRSVPPNQRRLERELVLAFDSGAHPVVLLTKADLIDDPSSALGELGAVASGVPVVLASGRDGTDWQRPWVRRRKPNTGIPGASGVGKSTLVTALLEHETMDTGAVRG
jgi:ribosome biogenesis GTPase